MKISKVDLDFDHYLKKNFKKINYFDICNFRKIIKYVETKFFEIEKEMEHGVDFHPQSRNNLGGALFSQCTCARDFCF